MDKITRLTRTKPITYKDLSPEEQKRYLELFGYCCATCTKTAKCITFNDGPEYVGISCSGWSNDESEYLKQ